MQKFDFTFSFVLIFTVVFSLCWFKTISNNLNLQIPNFLFEIPKPEKTEPQNNNTVSENVQVYMFMNASLMFDLTYVETTFEIINEGDEHYWISYRLNVPESFNLTVQLWERGKLVGLWYTWSRAHLLPIYSWNAYVTIENLSECNASITFISTPYDRPIPPMP